MIHYLKKLINSKKVSEFLNEKGFYIVLFFCICMITLSAYVVTRRNLASYIKDTDFDQLASTLSKDSEDIPVSLERDSIGMEAITPPPKVEIVETPPKTIAINAEVEKKEQEVEKKQPRVKPILESPVEGAIIKDFAVESLIYSKTLDQWMTHKGIDIAVKRGMPVKCAYDGIVEKVYNDSAYGITIIIDHGDGYKTKYSNLSSSDMVSEGDNIKKGVTISGIGNTALFEASDESHLHFEVIDNNINVNPKEYLK